MIVIHIGYSKAGSTTIQKFLGANVDKLRQIGVDYPSIGQTRRGCHVNLYHDLRGHRNFRPQYGAISQLVDYLDKREYETTIISAEEFHRCKIPEVTALKEILAAVDDNIKIQLIIRDLIDFMPSTYSQATKGGENYLDFDSLFIARVERSGNGFLEAARVWGSTFGWDRLRVRPLDRGFLLNGDLIDDFLAGVGVDPDGRRFKRSQKISNASPGWRVLEAVRALYSGSHGLPVEHALTRCAPDDEEEKKLIGRVARKLGDQLGWNADRGLYLSRAQAQKCVDIHSEAIASLNEFLPEGLPEPLDLAARGFVEREFMPEASRIPAQELRGFYDELASRVFQKRPAGVPALIQTTSK